MAKRKPIPEEHIERMLFWWVAFEHNTRKVARKVTEETGRKYSNKVVWQIAKREDFGAKEPFIKSKVDSLAQIEDNTGLAPRTPQEIRLIDMGWDLLTFDYEAVKRAVAFVQNDTATKTPYRNMAEVITTLNFVVNSVRAMTGEEDLRKLATQEASRQLGAAISKSVIELFDNISPKEKQRILRSLGRNMINGKVKLPR